MDRRVYLSAVCGVTASILAGCIGNGAGGDRTGQAGPADAEGNDTGPDGRREGEFAVETVAEGLEHPWGIAFLPEEARLFVTERDDGRLLLLDRESGEKVSIDGVPEVDAAGQGGLLDVTLHPEFPTEPWVYLTYSATNGDGRSTTHLGRGRFDRETAQLSEFDVLHAAEPFVDSDGHYGSRVVFGADGMVYLTVGDRQFKDFGPEHVSQDTTNELGSTLRLEPDGSVPEDNPFVGEDYPDVRDAIFSFGHRNAQGMAVHPETGELWQSEHGEQDGDEINVVEAGGNHGWPIATYGCIYGSGDSIGELPHEREDVVEPVYYWECNSGGFPPSGATFYEGDALPEWRGDLFVGNLAGRYLGHFVVDGRDVEELDPLLADRGWRIRAVEDAPNTGNLYVLIDDAPAPLVRLIPE